MQVTPSGNRSSQLSSRHGGSLRGPVRWSCPTAPSVHDQVHGILWEENPGTPLASCNCPVSSLGTDEWKIGGPPVAVFGRKPPDCGCVNTATSRPGDVPGLSPCGWRPRHPRRGVRCAGVAVGRRRDGHHDGQLPDPGDRQPGQPGRAFRPGLLAGFPRLAPAQDQLLRLAELHRRGSAACPGGRRSARNPAVMGRERNAAWSGAKTTTSTSPRSSPSSRPTTRGRSSVDRRAHPRLPAFLTSSRLLTALLPVEGSASTSAAAATTPRSSVSAAACRQAASGCTSRPTGLRTSAGLLMRCGASSRRARLSGEGRQHRRRVAGVSGRAAEHGPPRRHHAAEVYGVNVGEAASDPVKYVNKRAARCGGKSPGSHRSSGRGTCPGWRSSGRHRRPVVHPAVFRGHQGSRIQIEKKDDIRARTGRSPGQRGRAAARLRQRAVGNASQQAFFEALTSGKLRG